MPESFTDAAQAVREYVKGIDRATALRRAFAFWLAFSLVVSIVPPAVLYAGGPDLSPVGTASAAAWDLSSRTSTESASLDVTDIVWADDGTKAYASNDTLGGVDQYSASDPYNVSTLSLVRSNSNINSGGDALHIEIASDGKTILVSGNQGDSIVEYTLSTAYDISTASQSNSFSTGTSEPRGMDYSEDGSKLYVADGNNPQVYEYTLSTPWDTSTASQTNVEDYGSFAGGSDTAFDVEISQNGNYLFFSVYQNELYRLSLSDPYNISSYTQDQSWTSMPDDWAIEMSKDGSRLYVISFGGPIDQYSLADAFVSGTVTHASNGTAIEGASITVNASSASDTTDASGFYSLGLDNGTYEITATKGDASNSTTVTVSGSDVTNANITLDFTETDLRLEVPAHMWQNATEDFEVWDDSGNDSEEITTDTGNVTVTSSDPTNLSVDQANGTLTSTSDLTFNGEITITAKYAGEEVSKNVTVANLSVENMNLMQDAGGMTSALWGDVQHPETGQRQAGDQLTMRMLLVAVLVGAAAASYATSFAGIGATVVVVAMGWFMGWVGDGMAMVAVFSGLFIGLNVAANVDYSIRK